MTLELTWSFASEKDLADLQDFICTDAPALPGTADADALDPWWESDVEINIQEIEFPLESPREYVLLARDEHGLAGVVWCWEQHGPRRVKILGARVGMCRGGVGQPRPAAGVDVRW